MKPTSTFVGPYGTGTRAMMHLIPVCVPEGRSDGRQGLDSLPPEIDDERRLDRVHIDVVRSVMLVA